MLATIAAVRGKRSRSAWPLTFMSSVPVLDLTRASLIELTKKWVNMLPSALQCLWTLCASHPIVTQEPRHICTPQNEKPFADFEQNPRHHWPFKPHLSHDKVGLRCARQMGGYGFRISAPPLLNSEFVLDRFGGMLVRRVPSWSQYLRNEETPLLLLVMFFQLFSCRPRFQVA